MTFTQTTSEHKPATEAEYLAHEAQADYKSQFVDHAIYAMAGASAAHNRIVRNLIVSLSNCLNEGLCEVFPSDMLLRLPSGDYVYPDVSVVCEPVSIERKGRNGLDVLLNPTVVLEVLSESTENLDTGPKLMRYMEVPGLRYIVLVDSRKPYILLYARQQADAWHVKMMQSRQQRDFTDTEPLELLECRNDFAAIYRNVAFDTDNASTGEA